MKQFAFPLGDKPALTILGHADLRLTGWERQDASVDSEPGYSLKVEQDQAGLRITCLDDCEMYIPFATAVTIEKVSGDVHLSNLNGRVRVEKVNGSAVFYRTGGLEIKKIDGDCNASQVSGAFMIAKIGGSLEGGSFAGGLAVEKVGGDIQVRDVQGDLIARAGGSISAVLAEGYGRRVQLRAGGDIQLQFPGNNDGRYMLSCGAEEMDIRLTGRSEQVETGRYEFSIGDAARAEIELRAGGSLELTSQPRRVDETSTWQPDNEDESSNRQPDSAGDSSTRQPNLRPAGSGAAWGGIARSTEEAVNRAARRADEALRQAERRVEAALRGLERRGAPPDMTAPPASDVDVPQPAGAVIFVPAADAPGALKKPAAGVSDDERLMILKMLGEKKITVEEAEALIEALESPGQGD